MRIITKTVLILSLVSLFTDIASEMLYPVLPVYLSGIGFSVFWIGVLEGIVGFTAGISKGYFGKWSDRTGLRLPFVRAGYFLSAISKPMMGLLITPAWIFVSRTLDRLGKGIRVASRDALLSDEATPATKARVFGFNRAMDTLGATIGPILALVYLFFFPGDYKTLFLLAFLPGLASVALLFLAREKRKPASTMKKGGFFSFFGYWKIASREYRVLVSALVLFALFNSADIFLLLKTREIVGDRFISVAGQQFGADTITIAAYVFYNLVYAIGSYPAGMLADRWGNKKVFCLGLLLFAVVYAGFAAGPSITMVFVLFFIYGIYAAATEGVVRAWITNIANRENTATAIGFYTSCESISVLFASILAGLVWDKFGSGYTFMSTAVAAIFVLLYLLVRTGKFSTSRNQGG
jgi:MFS family permease